MWPSTQQMHCELAFNDGRVAQSPECHQNRTERRELTKDCFHWHKKARCIMISARHQLPGPTGWAALNTYKQGWGKCLCVTFSRSLKLSLPGLSWAWRDCCSNRLSSNHQFQSSGSSPFPEEQLLPVVSSAAGAEPIAAGLAVLSARLSQWPPERGGLPLRFSQWGNAAWLGVRGPLLIPTDRHRSRKQETNGESKRHFGVPRGRCCERGWRGLKGSVWKDWEKRMHGGRASENRRRVSVRSKRECGVCRQNGEFLVCRLENHCTAKPLMIVRC